MTIEPTTIFLLKKKESSLNNEITKLKEILNSNSHYTSANVANKMQYNFFDQEKIHIFKPNFVLISLCNDLKDLKLAQTLKRCKNNAQIDEFFNNFKNLKNRIERIKAEELKVYSELLSHEEFLLNEIENLEKTLRESESQFQTKNFKSEDLIDQKVPSNQPCLDYQNKISTNKPITMGVFFHSWHPNDHKVFLKIFKMWENDKDKRNLLLLKALSHIPKEEIFKHDEKYSSYLKKSYFIKSKIKEWKNKKLDESQKSNKKLDCEKASDSLKENNTQNNVKQINNKKVPPAQRKVNNTKTIKNKISHNIKENQMKKTKGYSDAERKVIKEKIAHYQNEKSLKLRTLQKNGQLNIKFSHHNKWEIEENLKKCREKDEVFIKLRKSRIEQAVKKRTRYIPQVNANLYIKPTISHYQKPISSFLCHFDGENKIDKKKFIPNVDLIPKKMVPRWRL